jgi:hypothetical protein
MLAYCHFFPLAGTGADIRCGINAPDLPPDAPLPPFPQPAVPGREIPPVIDDPMPPGQGQPIKEPLAPGLPATGPVARAAPLRRRINQRAHTCPIRTVRNGMPARFRQMPKAPG